MSKNFFLLVMVKLLLGGAWGQIALDTTISISSPEQESIPLNFPELNLQLEYRTDLRGTCPNRIQEGDLYSPDTNKVKVSKVPEDAAALYFIIDNCAGTLDAYADLEGKTFSLVTPSITYSLTLHELQNSQVQFIFTVVSTGIFNMEPFPILSGNNKAYGLSGKMVPADSRLRNQVKIIP